MARRVGGNLLRRRGKHRIEHITVKTHNALKRGFFKVIICLGPWLAVSGDEVRIYLKTAQGSGQNAINL